MRYNRIFLSVFLLLSGHQAFAQTSLNQLGNIDGHAVNSNAIAYGSNSFTNASGGIALGNQAIATGNNLSKTEYTQLMNQYQDLLNQRNQLAQELKTKESDVNTQNDVIININRSIQEIENNLSMYQYNSSKINSLQNQINEKTTRLNDLNNQLNANQAYLSDKSEYLVFLNILRQLDWTQYSDSQTGLENLSNQLKNKVDSDFPELANQYQTDDYSRIINGYVNYQTLIYSNIDKANQDAKTEIFYPGSNNQLINGYDSDITNQILRNNLINAYYTYNLNYREGDEPLPQDVLKTMESYGLNQQYMNFIDEKLKSNDNQLKNLTSTNLSNFFNNKNSGNGNAAFVTFTDDYNILTFFTDNPLLRLANYDINRYNLANLPKKNVDFSNKNYKSIREDDTNKYFFQIFPFIQYIRVNNPLIENNQSKYREYLNDINHQLEQYEQINWDYVGATQVNLQDAKQKLQPYVDEYRNMKEIIELYFSLPNIQDPIVQQAKQAEYLARSQEYINGSKKDLINHLTIGDGNILMASNDSSRYLQYTPEFVAAMKQNIQDYKDYLLKHESKLMTYDKNNEIIQKISIPLEHKQAEIEALNKEIKTLQEEILYLNRDLSGYAPNASEQDLLNQKAEKERLLTEAQTQYNQLVQLRDAKNSELTAFLQNMPNIQLSGQDSIAEGSNSFASGLAAIAIGANTQVQGDNAIAIGQNNIVKGENNQVMGKGNQLGEHANNNVVIGNNIKLADNLSNHIILGNTSQFKEAITTPNMTINSVSYQTAGGQPTGIMSIGSTGQERQIKHVAAGQVNAQSTDAINGSQLFATQQAISALANQAQGVDVDTWRTVLNIQNGDPNAVVYTNNQKDSILLAGTTISNLKNGNIAANSTDAINGSQLFIEKQRINDLQQNADGIDVNAWRNKLNINTTTIIQNQNAVEYSDNSKDTILLSGANGTTIRNLKAGDVSAQSTEAINGSQLFMTNQNVATNSANIAKGLNFKADSGLAINKQLGDTLSILGGNNITTKQENGNILVGLDANIQLDSARFGNVSLSKTTGINAGNLKITQVARGSISAQSTDAINGSQLFEMDKLNVKFTDETKTMVDIGGGEDGMNPTLLTGLKKGDIAADSLDAINGSQIHQILNQADGINVNQWRDKLNIKDAENAVVYTKEDKSVVKLAGENATGTVLENVADGEISANSRQAINGSQAMGLILQDMALQNQIHENKQAIQQLGSRIEQLDDKFSSAIASSNAIGGLVQATKDGQSLIAAGIGGYGSKQAFAVGVSGVSDNGKVIYKISGSLNLNGNKKLGYSSSVGYQF